MNWPDKIEQLDTQLDTMPSLTLNPQEWAECRALLLWALAAHAHLEQTDWARSRAEERLYASWPNVEGD